MFLFLVTEIVENNHYGTPAAIVKTNESNVMTQLLNKASPKIVLFFSGILSDMRSDVLLPELPLIDVEGTSIVLSNNNDYPIANLDNLVVSKDQILFKG